MVDLGELGLANSLRRRNESEYSEEADSEPAHVVDIAHEEQRI